MLSPKWRRAADAIAHGAAPERDWLVEHPALYTAGTSAKESDLIDARFPVHRVGRGGQFTYHGPGQRIAYVMLDLNRRLPRCASYVAALERWLIESLTAFEVAGETREDQVGVWVARPDKPWPRPAKWPTTRSQQSACACAAGRRFTASALNVDPDLSHFSGIAPCGIREPHYGVTSLVDLGRPATMAQTDAALRASFEKIFGPTFDPL